MHFVMNNLAARTHSYMMNTLCALTIVFPSVVCVFSSCMYITPATPWSTWIARCLQLRPTTSPSTTTVSMVMRITIRGRIFPKGGDDAEHPTIIPMYTSTTPQAPKGHTIRPRPYAMGHKVNSLLFEPYLPTYETWLLPHAWTLCILRLIRDDHGDSKDQGQAWKRRWKKREEDGAAAGVSSDVRTSLRIIWTQPDHPDAPRIIRVIPQPRHPKLAESPRRSRIIRTRTRIIRPLPTCMTWAEARVPLRPSLTPSWLSTIYRPPSSS